MHHCAEHGGHHAPNHQAATSPAGLTLEVEPETRAALVDWAREEARPVGNLVRRLLGTVVSERRQHAEEHAS
jgi:hypothetical protein